MLGFDRWMTSHIVAIVLGASVLLEGLLVLQFFHPFDGVNNFAGDPWGADYINLWTASYLNNQERLLEIFDFKTFHEVQTGLLGKEYQLRIWSYPPHFLFYVQFVAWLPYFASYCFWNVLTFTAYVAPFLWHKFRKPIIAALILSPATFTNVLAGQSGFLAGGLFLSGMLCLKNYQIVAGILFGLLSFKPQMGFLIPVVLMAARLWKPFVSAFATILVLLGASMVVHGTEAWRLFFAVTMSNNAAILEDGSGFLMYLMPTIFMSGRVLGLSNDWNYVLQGIMAVLVVLGTYWGVQRTADWEIQTALAGVGTFLVSPYAHNYDLTILSGAVVLLIVKGRETGYLHGERFLLSMAWFLPIGVILFNSAGVPIAPVFTLSLFILILLRIYLSAKLVKIDSENYGMTVAEIRAYGNA